MSNFCTEFTECEIISPGESLGGGNNLPNFSFERSPTSDNPMEEDGEIPNERFVMEIEE